MKFGKDQLLTPRTAKWSRLLALVNRSTPQHDWIFRGLEKKPEKGPDNEINIEILSHFDKAWRRRRPEAPRLLSRRFYEAWMLHEFRREAYHHLRNLPERGTLLEWLALGRHYGMPVRLVDFTYSFFVAIYFAICRKINCDDGWVLAFNLKLHKEELERNIVPDLAKTSKVPWPEAAFQDSRLFRRRNPRLAAQQGLFLCPANVEHDFDKNLEAALPSASALRKDWLKLIQVPSDLRTEIMIGLRRMNISAASLFPDLSGWAESQGDLVHLDIPDGRFKNELRVELLKPR